MPRDVVFSPKAAADLGRLQDYLSQRFYEKNARAFVQRLTQACVALGTHPLRGREREDIRPGIRSIGFERRATVLFSVKEEQVIILTIAYRGRSIDKLQA